MPLKSRNKRVLPRMTTQANVARQTKDLRRSAEAERRGFILVCCLALWSGCTGTADVELSGCPVVERGPVCVLAESTELKLVVKADRSAVVHVLQGGRELPLKADHRLADKKRIITVTASSEPPADLTVEVKSTLFLRQRRVIPLQRWQQPDWLTKTNTQLEAGQWDAAAATLQLIPVQQQSARERAWALAYKARIDKAQGKVHDARRTYPEAMAAAQQGGQVSLELTCMLELAMILADDLGHPEEAAALLKDPRLRELVNTHQPELNAWLYLHFAFQRYLLGDLSGALHESDKALQAARDYDARFVTLDLYSLRAEIFTGMGRKPEAEDELSALNKGLQAEPAPCWHAFALSSRGRARVVAREAVSGGEDPRVPLLEALSIAEQDCPLVPLAETILSDLTRAEILERRHAEASRWLELATRLVPNPQGAKQLERSELLGYLALGRAMALEQMGQTGQAHAARTLREEALRHFQNMQQHARGPDANEHVFRALIGLGRVQEGLDSNQALAAYRSAEKYLDTRSLDMPLGAGQGSYLRQNSRATRYLIELLVQQGRLPEAFAAIRWAARRALRTATARLRAPQLQGAAQVSWQQAIQKYRDHREETDQLIRKAENLPGNERDTILKVEVPKEEERLRQTLEDALKDVARAVGGGSEPLREPGDKEALLACHPGDRGTICILQTPTSFTLVRLPELTREIGAEVLAAQLVAPLADKLQQTRRLYVLPGELHDLDLHRVSFSGRPLEDVMEVRYSLDLPVLVPRPEEVPKRALVLFDLADDAHPRHSSAGDIEKSLRQDSWEVRRVSSQQQVHGSWPGQTPEPARADGLHLLDELRQPIGLLMIYGTAKTSEHVTGWNKIQLLTLDQTNLRVSDILMLPAPTGAVLLSCESGYTAQNAPGPEGLPLAQAYLMAGSRFAIGTTRRIDPELAARVAVALVRKGAAAVLADPAAELRRALQEARPDPASPQLRQQLEFARAEKELSTYRVFFP